MKDTTIDPANPPAVYEWTGPTGVHFKQIREPSGTYYYHDTPRVVIDALETARMNGQRIRLFTGNVENGMEWYDEYDVCGTVGRSMGPIKVPLLIRSPRSIGGGQLFEHIVRLIVNGREVYRHPQYKESVFTLREIKADEMPPKDRAYPKESLRSLGYTHAVDINGSNHANFKSEKAARRWIAFMKGERMAK